MLISLSASRSIRLFSADANVTWPLFTGGKRIFASKIGKTMVGIAEVNREQINADQQSKLVECYFGLRLGQRVVAVKEATYNSLKTHYDQRSDILRNKRQRQRVLTDLIQDGRDKLIIGDDGMDKVFCRVGELVKRLFDLDRIRHMHKSAGRSNRRIPE